MKDLDDFSKPRDLYYGIRACPDCGPSVNVAVTGYANSTQWCTKCNKVLLKNGNKPFSFFDWFCSKE